MISDKNSMIIVGGSQSHVPFIKAAKKIGYKTVVFDGDKNCKGAKISDSFCKISTHDEDKIISKCCELNEKKNIAGIMTYSSSTDPLMAVSKICEKLNLPSFSTESVRLTIDKVLMKECFSNNGIPTPEWIVTDNQTEAIIFTKGTSERLIIKPSNGSQGSKGVNLIDQDSDISKQFEIAKENSHDSKVILEKYYIGKEFSVDGIVAGDKPVILSVSEKFNLGPEFNFTMCGFSMGEIANEDGELQKAFASIKETAIKAVKAMNISNSFFSADIILTGHGPMVLECGVLLDCKIDRMLYYTGIDVYDLIIKIVTGQGIHSDKNHKVENLYLSFLFAPNEGQLNINSEEANKYDGIIEWEKPNGSFVKPPNSIADALGWIITKDKIHFDYKQNLIFNIE